jgi:hypothetical protein
MNDMFGINSHAPSGRFHLFALITQGIALTRSALGCILAALWAAVESSFAPLLIVIGHRSGTTQIQL